MRNKWLATEIELVNKSKTNIKPTKITVEACDIMTVEEACIRTFHRKNFRLPSLFFSLIGLCANTFIIQIEVKSMGCPCDHMKISNQETLLIDQMKMIALIFM